MRSCSIWDLAFFLSRRMCSANSRSAPRPAALWQVYLAALSDTKGASSGTALRPARFRQCTSGSSLPGSSENRQHYTSNYTTNYTSHYTSNYISNYTSNYITSDLKIKYLKNETDLNSVICVKRLFYISLYLSPI